MLAGPLTPWLTVIHSQESVKDAVAVLDGQRKGVDGPMAINFGKCVGRVQTSADTMELTQQYYLSRPNTKLDKLICIPEGVTGHQQISIVMKYLDQNPEKLHEPESKLIFLALAGAFPCE